MDNQAPRAVINITATFTNEGGVSLCATTGTFGGMNPDATEKCAAFLVESIKTSLETIEKMAVESVGNVQQ